MGVIKRKSKTAKNGYTYEVNFTYKEHGVTKRHFKRGFITKKEAELYEAEKKNEVQKNGALGKKKKITLNEGLIVTSNYLATNRDRRRCDRKVTPFFCVRRLILQYWVR